MTKRRKKQLMRLPRPLNDEGLLLYEASGIDHLFNNNDQQITEFEEGGSTSRGLLPKLRETGVL